VAPPGRRWRRRRVAALIVLILVVAAAVAVGVRLVTGGSDARLNWSAGGPSAQGEPRPGAEPTTGGDLVSPNTLDPNTPDAGAPEIDSQNAAVNDPTPGIGVRGASTPAAPTPHGMGTGGSGGGSPVPGSSGPGATPAPTPGVTQAGGGGTPVWRRGQFNITLAAGSDGAYDLDTGASVPPDQDDDPSQPDLAGGPAGLRALNGARFAASTHKSVPSATQCRGLADGKWSDTVPVAALLPGAYACVQTSEGRLGFVKVVKVTPQTPPTPQGTPSDAPASVDLEYVIWRN
jgi:hypothetical protein